MTMRTLPKTLAAVTLIATPLIPSAAHAAAATDTTRAFCTQLQTSQSAIGAIPTTAKNRFSLISAEWTKMARFAPTAVKNDVNAIAAAYKTANGQPAATQKTTLSKITKAAQNVTAFTAKSCAAGGQGDGPGGGRFAELADCVAKQGGKLPAPSAGGGAGGGGGQGNGGQGNGGQGNGGQRDVGGNGGGRGLGNLDPATQAAFDACRTELGLGSGIGGFGGGGGVRNNPEVIACLKKKGVTLPAAPAASAGQPGQRLQLNAKTQAALDACRKELGLPAAGRANGPRSGAPSSPTTTKA